MTMFGRKLIGSFDRTPIERRNRTVWGDTGPYAVRFRRRISFEANAPSALAGDPANMS